MYYLKPVFSEMRIGPCGQSIQRVKRSWQRAIAPRPLAVPLLKPGLAPKPIIIIKKVEGITAKFPQLISLLRYFFMRE
jgi:hypothetical protein